MVGIAYSGGGLTGLLASMCTHHTLTELFPDLETNATFSTASGGSLGFLVHQSTHAETANVRVVYPPTLSTRLTLEQMSSSTVARGSSWWAAAALYIPNVTSVHQLTIAAHQQFAGNRNGVWWQDVLSTMLRLGYGVQADTATVGNATVAFNVAALRAAGCPIQRNATSGVMRHASTFLRHAVVEASPSHALLRVHVTGGPQLLIDESRLSLLEAGAWSSAFWAAALVENRVAYDAELAAQALGVGLLARSKATTPPSSAGHKKGSAEEVYLLDGGLVDTTGIVHLLQRGIRQIVAVYNNNDALAAASSEAQAETASLAFLFGVAAPTDTMNSLSGPSLLQVCAAAGPTKHIESTRMSHAHANHEARRYCTRANVPTLLS